MKKNIVNRKNPAPDSAPDIHPDLYFVKQGETLDRISWNLGLENPRYLREYHNERCSYLDIVPENGTLRFLQKLYIPSSTEISSINKKIRECGESLCYLLPNGKIPLNINLINGHYSVRQTESDDGIQKSEYGYMLRFNYIKEEKERHYIDFSMNGFKKDSEDPDQKINDLASAFVEIIYPVTLVAGCSGNFIKAEPHKEIREMLSEMDTLKSYYTGPYAAAHIDRMKHTIADPQNMYKSVKKMLPLQFLFNRLYQADYHSRDTTVPYRDEFSWLAPASPIQLEMTHRTLPQTDLRFIELLQTGKSADYRTVQELHYTDQDYDEYISPHSRSVKAHHQALYTLDAKNFSIQKIRAELGLQIADYEKKITFELEKSEE